MQVLLNIKIFLDKFITIPKFTITDAVEILIIAFMIYEVLVWIKSTRAWMLLKGILILLVFVIVATIFNLSTILWISNKIFSVGVIALIVVFQPELRKALEQLARKKILKNVFNFDDSKNIKERFSTRTVNEIVKASFELAKHKTGALIVIENEISLSEYERTGINIDAEISNQLLINIFEHNTPLHDGAVIVRGDRIVSATCYLPLSDNMQLSKELGTRHRAGVGVSEVTDSLTIIVSEETGKVSLAYRGNLDRNIDGDTLREKLEKLQNRTIDNTKKFKIWKGRRHNEKGIDK
ncbi:MAG: diadenylate cyclase CdaA [Lachnospiraceae bacterium]|nr:diadenylate cyclase CdaA [Lachnospiraceae bacterium]